MFRWRSRSSGGSGDPERDTFGRALALAGNERNEGAAVDRYLATLNADPAASAAVRMAYRDAIEEVLRENRIGDPERERLLSRQLWASFGTNLRLTIAEHLREQQTH